VKLIYRVPWRLCRCFYQFYCHWQTEGAHHVPTSCPAILAANHASFLDPPLVGAALPRAISYLARENLFRFPVFGSLLRAWDVVPVDREGGSPAGLKAILDRLAENRAVVLFPEGTRSRDGQLQPARSGIGLLVIKSTAPVVPILIRGTFEAYSRGMLFPRPRPVSIRFGAPLNFDALRAEAKHCSKPRLKEIYREVATGIMTGIRELNR
jgi:1-acyl-sn-glycerol-3-phosphate acyltransferase